MRKIGVKKLAAIAAGAALVGTALAPLASAAVQQLEKSDVYDTTTGSPIINIAVGSLAGASDFVWAANAASAVARNAVMAGTTSCTVSGAAAGAACAVTLGDVDLTVGGTQSYGAGAQDYKADLNSYAGSTVEFRDKWLSDSQLPHLYNSSDTYKYNGSNTTITVKEYIGVNADAQMDMTHVDVEDLVLYLGSEGDFNYNVSLGNGIPAYETATTTTTMFGDDTNDNIQVPWFGDSYTVDQVDLNNASGAYMKLVVSKAKETYLVGESFTAVGKGDYDGQTLTVTLTKVVKTSDTATYQATLQLTDEEGNVVDTQTSLSGQYVTFEDAEGDEVLEDSLWLDLVAADISTTEGYIQVLLGANVVDLYAGNGYPYDSSNTTGPWNWKVQMTTNNAGVLTGTCSSGCLNAEKVTEISIFDSNLIWDEDNPIYPASGALTAAGQAGINEVSLYNDYATIEFAGFETDESLTTIDIDDGVITYKDTGDTSHTIPFYIKLSDSTSGSTFTFDTKTIWYKVNKTDVNFYLGADNNVFNGVTVNFTADKNVMTDGSRAMGLDGNTMTKDLNGVTITCSRAAGAATSAINCLADGNVQFRQDSSTGTVIGTSATAAINGASFYYDDGNTASLAFSADQVQLEGANSQYFQYALFVSETYGDVWLLLDKSTNFAVQYNKDLEVQGTVGGAVDTTENAYIDYTYYLPDALEFGLDSSDNDFGTFVVSVEEEEAATADYDFNVYFNTATKDLFSYPNNNLTWPTVDLNYGFGNTALNGITFTLREDTPESYTAEAYTDFGSKLTVDGGAFTAVIPENIPQVVLWVKGKETTRETTGGEALSVAEGETGQTSAGTKVTVDAVNYECSCEGAVGGDATCVASPATYMARAPGKVEVFTDLTAPATRLAIIGGWKVNTLAPDGLREMLLAAGDYELYKDATGNVIMAGFTGNDTGMAVEAFIEQVEAFV